MLPDLVSGAPLLLSPLAIFYAENPFLFRTSTKIEILTPVAETILAIGNRTLQFHYNKNSISVKAFFTSGRREGAACPMVFALTSCEFNDFGLTTFRIKFCDRGFACEPPSALSRIDNQTTPFPTNLRMVRVTTNDEVVIPALGE